MAYRKRMSKGKSKRVFRKTAMKVHRKNGGKIMRGGILC